VEAPHVVFRPLSPLPSHDWLLDLASAH
jgi:hypothetical protein